MTDEKIEEIVNGINEVHISYSISVVSTEILYDIDYINERIKREICYNTLSELSDEKLLPFYKVSKSFIKKTKTLEQVLDKNDVDCEKKKKILTDYMLELISPGLKGAIRGSKFNEIVKKAILENNPDNERFKIRFEEQYDDELYTTNEKPDWYIVENSTKKKIIGMNQLDLWGGGAQTNRGAKYLEGNNRNNEKSKLLCVICNFIEIRDETTKIYKLFKIGFENNTLCYLNNLQNIINSYFKK